MYAKTLFLAHVVMLAGRAQVRLTMQVPIRLFWCYFFVPFRAPPKISLKFIAKISTKLKGSETLRWLQKIYDHEYLINNEKLQPFTKITNDFNCINNNIYRRQKGAQLLVCLFWMYMIEKWMSYIVGSPNK